MLRTNHSEFFSEYFDYRPGESVVIIAPTGAGKTYTAYEVADRALRQNPELSLTTLQPKPADQTTLDYAAKFGLRIADSYPFRKHFWEPEPNGWVHWPVHIRGDAEADDEHLTREFKRSLDGEYWAGDKLVLVDDTYVIAAMLKCNREVDKYLIAGRSNNAGLISCLQQPRGTVHGGSVSSFHYNQPTHMFLGKDGNAQNRARFAEIAAGIDPAYIDHLVSNLKVRRIGNSAVSDLLYIDRRGPYMAIISP